MSFSFTPAGRHPIEDEDNVCEKPSLEEMFNHGRVKPSSPLWHKVLFLCYMPLGMVVLTVRILLFVMLCVMVLLLPRSIGDKINIPLLRLVCGVVVRNNYRGKPLADEPHIIAANHVADFDTFAMWLVMPMFHTLTGGHLKALPLVGAVYKKLGAVFVTPTPEGRTIVKDTVQELVKTDPNPILIFPEGGLTNGRVGTMMYHRFVFSLDCAIVPLAIALKDPWPVYHDYLGSTWARNFLWFLIVPFHIFDLNFLPAQKRNEGETAEAFAFRVQRMTCEKLNIKATKWAYSEKKELWKQISEGKKKVKHA